MPLKSQHDSITESSFELAECMYTRQKKKKKKICTLGGFGEFYLNLEWMHLMLYINLMNSKLKSVAHQRNTPHLNGLWVTSQKLQNDQ